MPYENETSDFKATGNNIKNILNNNTFKNLHTINLLDNKIITGLQHLNSKNLILNLQNDKKYVYDFLHCIDGSMINISENNNEILTLRCGSALLDIQSLFSLEKNNFGIFNPYHVAKLFDHSENLYLDGIFPGKNTYLMRDDIFLDTKNSFLHCLEDFFSTSLGHTIKESFFSSLPPNSYEDTFQKIINDIRDDNLIFNTKREVQQIMLITENLISQYLLNENINKSSRNLVVIDGRLQNQEIGSIIKEKNNTLITNTDNMLMGVQKTGILNILLSKIHELLKKENKEDDLKELFNSYKNGESILFILNKKFKEIINIPNSNHGSYGVECLYISEEPDRKEFVFTTPSQIFDNKYPINKKVLDILSSLISVLEHTHTNLYINEKGALLSNIIAHSNVSLNKKNSSVLMNVKEDLLNSSKKKSI